MFIVPDASEIETSENAEGSADANELDIAEGMCDR